MQIMLGNCLEVLPMLAADSVDSIVTDPPYGLSFMGKKWDYDVPSVAVWKECLRVLKPGGHLLAFGGTRTYHRLVVAIEDAGFEIRDQIQWLYGQGFPKSLDISKAIDKAAEAEREVIGKNPSARPNHATRNENIVARGQFDSQPLLTAPATPEAQKWSGWGTALKPANEPICLARKPLSEKTVAANVLKHGTGGLNIDGTRIGTDIRFNQPASSLGNAKTMDGGAANPAHEGATVTGRFPSNVILDEEAAAVLDGQTEGTRASKPSASGRSTKNKGSSLTGMGGTDDNPCYTDTGGASRFFYVAKASKSERGRNNSHPTVKPISLMKYLIRLITPEGGTVLDPFMGSGTTGIAANNLGHGFIGIEMNPDYLQIAEARLCR